jgi:tetratricopeptide (TPR) repeat protein
MEIMNESLKILDTISKYQEIYNREPESKIFAPLAEAYRKSGKLEHAFAIAQKGITDHPEFASGLVTFSRILIDMNQLEESIEHLKLATEMSPDNFLAHKLLGETYLKLKRPSKALQVFKMALYLDPLDSFAKKMVKKLESISASDFEDTSLFSTDEPPTAPNLNSYLTQPASESKAPTHFKNLGHELDRYVSLIDAHISRNDYVRASSTLTEALNKLGKSPELQRRLVFLSQRFEDSSQKLSDIDTTANHQLKILNTLLSRIEDRRIY